ncbi:GNAT family N-acetyltransferase [Nocardia sp. NPDC050712]|uniref:GNAT family N-acetyltransferase n=1 Tax=Nocardia sp. NPDC050712 TaxID=3155518 RepID=UPI0033EF5047
MAQETAIELRPGRAADAPAVAQLWYDGWREAHLGNVSEELVAIRSRESFDTRAAQLVPVTIVATVDGAVAGFVMVEHDEVEQVYLGARHRGSGVATLLLAAAEQAVRDHGQRRAWLAVVAGNTRARRFYERNGWLDDGEFVHAAPGPDGPVPVPSHRYVKHLS